MNTKIFKTKDEVTSYVADLLIQEIKNKSNIVLGLATGSTFEEVYAKMTKIIQNHNLDLSKVVTFNLDEYVGLDKKYHNQSYLYYMDHHFFSKTNILDSNTNLPIDYVQDVANGTEFPDYDKKIVDHGKIDVQVLGLGENGHIGFNEPGSSLDSITRCVELTPSTIHANSRLFNSKDEVPRKSVTMGMKTITKLSKKIILVVLGHKKEAALKKLLTAKSYDPNWPCTALHNYDNLTIVTDIEFNK